VSKKYEIIDNIIEIGIYLLFIFLFLTKGEGVRNVLLFSNFFLWLITLRNRKNMSNLYSLLALLFWGYMLSILISVFISIDRNYSLTELDDDFLKALLFFPVLSTVLSDEKRLKRFLVISLFILLLIVSVGFYSYLTYDLPCMMAKTPLKYALHNRFARDLNTLLPFSFVLLLIARKTTTRIFIIIPIVATILAIIMSASRGGAAAFFCTILVWLLYSLRKKHFRLKPLLAGTALLFIVLSIVSYFFIPDVQKRIQQTRYDAFTINKRMNAWVPLLEAVKERPVFGWGYGIEIFRMDLPFEQTPFRVSPYKNDPDVRDPHNTFLSMLFHQGIIGFILYLAMLIVAIKTSWSTGNSTDNLSGYILISCASVLVGTYVIHSLLEVVKFRYLALILGVGIAAQNVKK
jgi:O-antigen ligase